MTLHHALPSDVEDVRTTDVFDDSHHPAGLLRAHRVAEVVSAGESVVIPPAKLHHVEITGPVAFALEFSRLATARAADPGAESTVLAD